MASPPLVAELQLMLSAEKAALNQLTAAYSAMAKDLQAWSAKTGPGAVVQRAQARQIQRVLQLRMADMWEKIGDTITANGLRAAAKAGEPLQEAIDHLKAAGLSQKDLATLTESLRQRAESSVEAAMRRIQGQSYVPLARSVYRAELFVNDKLNQLVNQQLLKGANAADFAKAMRQYVRPDAAGGVRYAASRLARTEINNAFHATTVERIKAEPWVEAARWNLSGSHKTPDQCNEYAEQEHFKGGEGGAYRKNDVPARPHPQCLCYVTAEDVTDEQFIKGFKEGKYNSYLEENGLLEKAAEETKWTFSKTAAPGPGQFYVHANGKNQGIIMQGASSKKWYVKGDPSDAAFDNAEQAMYHLVKVKPPVVNPTAESIAKQGTSLPKTKPGSVNHSKTLDNAVKLNQQMADIYFSTPGNPTFDNFAAKVFQNLGQGNKIVKTKLNGYNLQYFYDEAVAQKTSISNVIKAFDHQYAKAFGKANEQLFEKKMFDYLGTESGQWKANQLAQKSGVPSSPLPNKATTPTIKPPTMVDTANYVSSQFKEISTQAMLKMHQSLPKWTADTRSALKRYTGSAYGRINSSLRNAGGAKSTVEIRAMDAGMRGVTQDILVHRGTTGEAFGVSYNSLADLEQMVGKTIVDEGYMSTSVGGQAAFSSKPVLMEIEVPKGARAAYLKPISQFDHENELLLARGTQMKIVRVSRNAQGKIVVRLRVVKQRGD